MRVSVMSAVGNLLLRLTVFIALAWFPVGLPLASAAQQFEHAFGMTSVEGQPQRIVSLSYNGADFFLALDVRPVAIRHWYGGDEYGLWPWVDETSDGFEPAVIRGPINVEAIAALEPDLIEAIWTDLREDEYRLLSKIAPVIAPKPGYGPYETSWPEMLTTIGRAVGKEDRAGQIIERLQDRIENIRRKRPDWQGKTAAIGQPKGPVFFNDSDVRWRILQALGFEMPDALKAVMGPGFFTRISPEVTDPYDADLVFWLDEGAVVQHLEALPLRHTMGAYREGREIVAPVLLSGALAYSSPLSLDYALDRLVPLIDAAIDGDPASPVPGNPAATHRAND